MSDWKMYSLLQCVHGKREELTHTANMAEGIQRAIEYIEEHITEDMYIEEIAGLPNSRNYRLAGDYDIEWYPSLLDNYCEIWLPVERV